MDESSQEPRAVRVAVEGCGHGTLNAIYASVAKSCEARGWDGVDLLIIGGDFQAVRNAFDLTVMSCPVKYREIGDFHEYYSGARTAPYLTIFVGGNHEASSHLWELYYGGWVAPNIYYMGAANVLRLGPIRIAAMTGIWKGYNYNKPHHERLPYSQDDIKSIYHIRELDVRKLLQLRTQVDVGISHDWPRAVERHGDERALWRMKPDFERESKDGTLGSSAAMYVMDRLRPPYWFSAHMHCKFAATKVYEEQVSKIETETEPSVAETRPANTTSSAPRNEDEIDLDLDDEDEIMQQPALVKNEDEISLDDEEMTTSATSQPATSAVPEDIRAQLPASFRKPAASATKSQPGQPVPATISNKVVRFLALDKCLPGRKFLQLLEVEPHEAADEIAAQTKASPPFRFEYDPEWLAITRVFASALTLGGSSGARPPPDVGEEHYRPLIEVEEAWVNEHIVRAGKLEIPRNFELTAPVHTPGSPEKVPEGPQEYNNPQTAAFCQLLDIENKFFATDEERQMRMANGPPPEESRRDFGGGRGRGWGREGNARRGRGGRGRGWGGGQGRGGGRGRGRG